jgi:hypothetical protein
MNSALCNHNHDYTCTHTEKKVRIFYNFKRSAIDIPTLVKQNSRSFMEGFPSGQRDQTVNLTAHAFEGSNPSPSKVYLSGFLTRV